MEISAQKKKEAAFQRRMGIEHSLKNRLKPQPMSNRAVFYGIVKVDPEVCKDDLRDKFNASIGQFDDIWGGSTNPAHPNRSHSNSHLNKPSYAKATAHQKQNQKLNASTHSIQASASESSCHPTNVTIPSVKSSQLTQDLQLFKKQQLLRNQRSEQQKEQSKLSNSQQLKNVQKQKRKSHIKPSLDSQTTPEQPSEPASQLQSFTQPPTSQNSTSSICHTPQNLPPPANQDDTSKLIQFYKFNDHDSFSLLGVLDTMLEDLRPHRMMSPLVLEKENGSQMSANLSEEKGLDPKDPSYNEELFGKFESDDDEEEEEEREVDVSSSSTSSSSESACEETQSVKCMKKESGQGLEEVEEDRNSWSLSNIMRQINEDSQPKPALPSKSASLIKEASPTSSLVSPTDYPFSYPSIPSSSSSPPPSSNPPTSHSPYQSSLHSFSVASSIHNFMPSENSRDVPSPSHTSEQTIKTFEMLKDDKEDPPSILNKEKASDNVEMANSEEESAILHDDQLHPNRSSPFLHGSPIKIKSLKQSKKRKAADLIPAQQKVAPPFESLPQSNDKTWESTKKMKFAKENSEVVQIKDAIQSIPCKVKTSIKQQSGGKVKNMKASCKDEMGKIRKDADSIKDAKESDKEEVKPLVEKKALGKETPKVEGTAVQQSILPSNMPPVELVFTLHEVEEMERMHKKRNKIKSLEPNSSPFKSHPKVINTSINKEDNNYFDTKNEDVIVNSSVNKVHLNKNDDSSNINLNLCSNSNVKRVVDNSNKGVKVEGKKIKSKSGRGKEEIKKMATKEELMDNKITKVNKNINIMHKDIPSTNHIDPKQYTLSSKDIDKSIKNASLKGNNNNLDNSSFGATIKNVNVHDINENYSQRNNENNNKINKEISNEMKAEVKDEVKNVDIHEAGDDDGDNNKIEQTQESNKSGLSRRTKKIKTSLNNPGCVNSLENTKPSNSEKVNSMSVKASIKSDNGNSNISSNVNIKCINNIDVKRRQELERITDHSNYKDLIKKSPQAVYEDATKLMSQVDAIHTANNVNNVSAYKSLLTLTDATSCYLAHFLMTNSRNISTIDYLFKNIQTIEQQLVKLNRNFEVTRTKVLLLRLKALINLNAYNIKVGQKGSDNFKATVDKLRIANGGPSPKQSPDSSTNMTSESNKVGQQNASQCLIAGMDSKELNDYAYTTTFLQLAHQCFDESNKRLRCDPECKEFYGKLEKRFGVFHFYMHHVNLMVYVQGVIQALRLDVRKVNGEDVNANDEKNKLKKTSSNDNCYSTSRNKVVMK